ncbi:unnamed protein product [Urochloa humidicola]
MGRAARSFLTRNDVRALEFTSERGAKQEKNARFWRDEVLFARSVDPVGEAHLHSLEAERIHRELTREAVERYAAERAVAAATANKAAASVPYQASPPPLMGTRTSSGGGGGGGGVGA